MNPKLSISIVSHRHQEYVCRLIEDLSRIGRSDFEVILTLNLPEEMSFDQGRLPFPIRLISNKDPKGFAANHNTAFALSEGDYFVILNPDIKLLSDPFDILLSLLNANPNSICAPSVVNEAGNLEDSARTFPTPVFLANRVVRKIFKFPLPAEFVPTENDVLVPDWVAGMFVIVPRSIYQKLHGFDERYHMYFEDVDFCARARLAGYQVLVSKQAKVVHNAQRDSHRKIRYMLWHLKSAFKFFTSNAYVRLRWNQLFGAW